MPRSPPDTELKAVLAAAGFTLDAETGEIEQLVPYVGAPASFSGGLTHHG